MVLYLHRNMRNKFHLRSRLYLGSKMILHNQKSHHPTLPVKSQMIGSINSKKQTQGQQLKFVDNFAVQSTNFAG